MIRALVADDQAGQGVRLSIVHQRDDATRPDEILRIIGDERGVRRFHWQKLTLDAMTEPTMQVPGEIAQALFDALTRHYHGDSDTLTDLPVIAPPAA